jgi:predicted nucleic acid-binding protein
MTFNDLAANDAVFIDANTLVFHFSVHPVLSPPCSDLLERIERQELKGYTSSHVLSDVAHRLMTLEAAGRFGWPHAGIAQRLKRHIAEIPKLSRYRQAIDEVKLFGIQVLPTDGGQVSLAADVSRQHSLLGSDALIVVVMRTHGLTNLASHDADFDRVPGITRYAPV